MLKIPFLVTGQSAFTEIVHCAGAGDSNESFIGMTAT
jgi:hypothetical protein